MSDRQMTMATFLILFAILAVVALTAALHWRVHQRVMDNLDRIEQLEELIHKRQRR